MPICITQEQEHTEEIKSASHILWAQKPQLLSLTESWPYATPKEMVKCAKISYAQDIKKQTNQKTNMIAFVRPLNSNGQLIHMKTTRWL